MCVCVCASVCVCVCVCVCQALSNQKYREMQEQFKDVGLMTGDVTINPSASCLVMTTEVIKDGYYNNNNYYYY